MVGRDLLRGSCSFTGEREKMRDERDELGRAGRHL